MKTTEQDLELATQALVEAAWELAEARVAEAKYWEAVNHGYPCMSYELTEVVQALSAAQRKVELELERLIQCQKQAVEEENRV